MLLDHQHQDRADNLQHRGLKPRFLTNETPSVSDLSTLSLLPVNSRKRPHFVVVLPSHEIDECALSPTCANSKDIIGLALVHEQIDNGVDRLNHIQHLLQARVRARAQKSAEEQNLLQVLPVLRVRWEFRFHVPEHFGDECVRDGPTLLNTLRAARRGQQRVQLTQWKRGNRGKGGSGESGGNHGGRDAREEH